jgi:phosphatidate phosphatase PAH1
MRHLLLASSLISMCGCTPIPPADVPRPTLSQNEAVVTDVDGTLTPRNIEVFMVRPGAVEALNAISRKGYKIVYLTARTPLFQSGLPDWLRKNGFPPGTLHVAQTFEDSDHPDKFKANVLAAYTNAGWHLAYAYGDSHTDFTAYAEAKIQKEHVFALKRKGSKACENGLYQACIDGWVEHLTYIEHEISSI